MKKNPPRKFGDRTAADLRFIKFAYTLLTVSLIIGMVAGIRIIQNKSELGVRSIFSKAKIAEVFIRWNMSRGNFQEAAASVTREGNGPAQSVPILLYHGILPEWDGTLTNISRERFREHMFALKAAGYETISLDDLRQFLKGQKELPPKAVMITFDDGRKDSYYESDPIFATLGMRAVMFQIAKFALSEENNYYLTRNELAMIEENGRWDTGSHGFEGHGMIPNRGGGQSPFYTTLAIDPETGSEESFEAYQSRIRADLAKSQESLSSYLKKPIPDFALPFGDFGQHLHNDIYTKAVLQEAGSIYDMIFFQEASPYRFTQVVQEHADIPWHLVRRINVNPQITGIELLQLLERGRAKDLPYEASLTNSDGWVEGWNQAIADGALELIPATEASGAAVILDGSQTWRDYSVRAEIETNNRGVYVWTRFKDDRNNVACNFGNGFAHVEQILDGQKNVLRGIRSPELGVPQRAVIEARVTGRTLSCLIDGKVIVSSSFLDPSLDRGGIGFKTWDAVIKSSLKIYSLTVTPITQEGEKDES